MKFKTILLFISISLFFIQCNKEDETENQTEDLTTEVTGVYTSGSCLVITVTKVDNQTVSMRIQDCNNDETHAATIMNSKTTFTLNKVTVVSGSETYEYTGTGIYTTNAIDITRTEKQIETATGIVSNSWTETYSGTK